jgi:hypothetical protein
MVLPEATHEWNHLGLQNFKTVVDVDARYGPILTVNLIRKIGGN